MATPWADYCVSAVRYHSGGMHIDAVRVHIHDVVNSKMPFKADMTRTEVVKLLAAGKTFLTITVKDGKYQKGAPLKIITVATDYITTKADKSTKDNLESLPSF
jgi:hypothetical protein